MGKSARNIVKSFLGIVFILSVFGCASVSIPNYIQDKNPYEKTFYAPFDSVHKALTKALEVSGWSIERESEPALFERERDLKSGNKQTLIFTGIRQTPLFLGSRYARMNVYLHEIADKETEVEIRYVMVTSVVFKSLYGYENDRGVEHIFDKIEENLGF